MVCPLHRLRLLFLLLSPAPACHEWADVRECPPGQQEHEDRCLPTPSIVFLRCVEAFRTEKIEHDRSSQLAIDANAPTGKGAPIGGSLSRAKLDRESREYTVMPEDGIHIAVAECRRQEESERESRLAAALHEAAAAQTELHQARAEAATALAKLDGLENVASSLREDLEAAQAELVDARERIGVLDPCAAEAWDACAEKAAIAHETGDHPAAARMNEIACKGGHARACDNLGRLQEHGLGVAADTTAAFRHYTRGCELGSIDACVSEGVLAQVGRGTKRDPVRAARRFAKACREDSARGCWCFADALERGLGVERDEDRASASYARACELGEHQACEDGERLAPPIARAALDNPSTPTR
jgi:TPR repeat protein